MKLNITLSNKVEKFIFTFLGIILGLCPLYNGKLENVSVIIFFILIAIVLLSNPIKPNWSIFKYYFILALLYLTLFISFVPETNNNIIIWERLLKMQLLFWMPFIFFFYTSTKMLFWENFFSTFKLTYVLACLILIVFILIGAYYYSHPIYPQKYSSNFLRSFLDSSYLNRHHIYNSMFLAIGGLLALDKYYYSKGKLRYFYVIIAIIILLTILAFSSRGVFIATVIAVMAYLLKKSRKHFIFVSIIGSISLVFLICYLPLTSNGFLLLVQPSKLQLPEYNSFNIRLISWRCALDLISNHPLFGVGLDQSKLLVDTCLKSNISFDSAVIYNSHNQFLGTYLNAGLIGCISLILVFATLFRKTLKTYPLGLSLCVLFLIIMLHENILERQTGILIFSLFSSIILVNTLHEDKK
jgi:O-antigen ligase